MVYRFSKQGGNIGFQFRRARQVYAQKGQNYGAQYPPIEHFRAKLPYTNELSLASFRLRPMEFPSSNSKRCLSPQKSFYVFANPKTEKPKQLRGGFGPKRTRTAGKAENMLCSAENQGRLGRKGEACVDAERSGKNAPRRKGVRKALGKTSTRLTVEKGAVK